MDKQLTPYQHTLRWRWRMLPECSEFQSQSVQIFGYMDQHWRSSGSFWTKVVRTPTCWCLVERQLPHVLLGLGWEKNRIGNARLFIENRDYSSRCTWMTSKWLKRSRKWLTCGRKTEQSLLMNTEKLNHEFSAGVTENLQVRENTSRKHGCVVLRYGSTCSKMRWEILWTGEQQDRTVIQSLKSLLGWSIGVCSMTQILLATFRIQNQLREESCVSLEVEHSFLSVRCAGMKRQYPTVLQNLKSSCWILDYEWMDYLLSTSGMW